MVNQHVYERLETALVGDVDRQHKWDTDRTNIFLDTLPDRGIPKGPFS